MEKVTQQNHESLALWAANCAERVLYVFESENQDERPRRAIQAARDWVEGKAKMVEARKFAFAAHAAAREATAPKAKAAARAAGHAAATAHVSSHAQYAASYALKASTDVEQERNWQSKHNPIVFKTNED